MKTPLQQAAAALGKKGGESKTDAKTAAARSNGAKGGRPSLYAYVCQTNNGDGWINIGQAGPRAAAMVEAKQQRQWLKDDEIANVQVRVKRYELG